jgi:hypothetical protein
VRPLTEEAWLSQTEVRSWTSGEPSRGLTEEGELGLAHTAGMGREGEAGDRRLRRMGFEIEADEGEQGPGIAQRRRKVERTRQMAPVQRGSPA